MNTNIQSDDLSTESSDELQKKDSTEIELENLIFGDEDGFYQNIRSQDKDSFSEILRASANDPDDRSDAENEKGIQDVDDADLFMFDSIPSKSLNIPRHEGAGPGDADSSDENVAWIDSDDERLTISLASNTRLRKLRLNESEDVINGKEYIKRLRRQYEQLHPAPRWAKQSQQPSQKRRKLSIDGNQDSEAGGSSDAMSEDEELSAQPLAKLLRNADNLTAAPDPSSKTQNLRPEIIDMHRLKDISGVQKSSVTSLSFHPHHPLLLSSGPSSTIHLHHINPHPPNPNPLLTTLHIRSTPLTTTVFHPPSGNKIIFSGRRRYFHTWDLNSGHITKTTRTIGHLDTQRSMEDMKPSPCGRWIGLLGTGRKGGGFINILDAHTSQWISEIRIEGKGGVADFAWWSDGDGLVGVGKGGEVVEWDGREKAVVRRWMDEGAVGTTVLALGGTGAGPKSVGGDRWVALGSSSGVVNVYDRRRWSAETPGDGDRPKLVRTFDQLTTPVSHLVFTPGSTQMLCMASRWKRDALRLVHLPSCTVYKNWPTAQTPLGRISGVAWSPDGAMLAVGNEQGKIRLWEVRG